MKQQFPYRKGTIVIDERDGEILLVLSPVPAEGGHGRAQKVYSLPGNYFTNRLIGYFPHYRVVR